jgi:FkbM family methyltransferase
MDKDPKFIEDCTGPCDWDKLIIDRFLEFVPENSIVADIGANVGSFTFELNYKNIFKKIYAIEADKETFNVLKNKSSEDSNVELINVAVSNTVGKVEIYEGTGTSETRNILGLESLQKNFKLKNVKRGEVNAATLDYIFDDKLKIKLDACKIDVEGAEVLVIEGGKKTISKMKCLFVECHNEQTYKSIIDMCLKENWTVKCLKNLYTIKSLNDLDFCYQIIIFPNYSKFYS